MIIIILICLAATFAAGVYVGMNFDEYINN